MYVYTPIHYALLIEYSQKLNPYSRTVSHKIIEEMAAKCEHPAFRTVRFRKALITYRRFGKRPVRQTKWRLDDAVYFAKNSYHVHNGMKLEI